MCLDNSVSLAGISSKFASMAARIKEHGKPPLPPALGAELSLLLSEALTVVTRCMANLGVQLPTEAPLLPVTLSFAIKRTVRCLTLSPLLLLLFTTHVFFCRACMFFSPCFSVCTELWSRTAATGAQFLTRKITPSIH